MTRNSRRPGAWRLAAGFALLAVAGACGGAAAPAAVGADASAPERAATPDTGRVLTGTFESEHGTRTWRLLLPGGTAPAAGRPLVVLLHGCAQDAAALAQAGRFDAIARDAGAMVLYPEQPAAANPLRCWNWFLPAHQVRGSGEPALIAALTRTLAAEHGADPDRITIGGLSAGGAMAVLLAVAYPDLYAAAATHSAVGWRVAHDVATAYAAMRGEGVAADSQAQEAVRAMGGEARLRPLIALHGSDDTLAAVGATHGLVRQFRMINERLLGAALERDSATVERSGRRVRLTRYTHGDSTVVEEWLIRGLGHALSGGDPAARWTDPAGPDGAREMMRFLLERRRGAPLAPEAR